MALFALLVAAHVAWFHSPSGNIQCEVAPGYAYCQTFTPLQTATLHVNGRSVICTHRACPVGNGPENAVTLAYGRSLRVGTFRCTSLVTGMRCVVAPTGHGFTIARQGVRTF